MSEHEHNEPRIEDATIAQLMDETRARPGASIGSRFTCGCCVDSEYVAEHIEPPLRRAYRAGVIAATVAP